MISIYKEDLSEFTRTIKEDTLTVVKEVIKPEENQQQREGESTARRDRKRGAAGAGKGEAGSAGLANFFSFMDSLKDDEDEEVLYCSLPLIAIYVHGSIYGHIGHC